MDWRRLLLAGLIVSGTFVLATTSSAHASIYEPVIDDTINGDGRQVELDGVVSTKGSNQSSSAPGSNSGTGDTGDTGDTGEIIVTWNRQPLLRCDAPEGEVCEGGGVPIDEPPDESGTPAITIRDLAAFRPAPPEAGGEPDGVAVLGLPANFVASASQQIIAGTLLEQPAEVRFTPIAFRWEYGDGGTRETGRAGSSWAELGQAEFTETATSHRYTAKADFTVALATAYSAEYRFAGSAWLPVDGQVFADAAPYPVRVVEIDTRLVRGSCAEYPSDPGC